MIHEILPVGMLQCNCSIFGDEQSHEAVVIDPGDEIQRILAILAKHQLRVKAIIITHAHIEVSPSTARNARNRPSRDALTWIITKFPRIRGASNPG